MLASAPPTAAPAARITGEFGRALGAHAVHLRRGIASPGQLGRWQERNAAATIPHAIDQLRSRGMIQNFARLAQPEPQPAFSGGFPFVDTDLYKTLEGVVTELGARASDDAEATARLRRFVDEAIEAICGAQRPDGYVGTYLSGADAPHEQWSAPATDHELYNLGHLIQAALATRRHLGDVRLLVCAVRFADLVLRRFGPGGDERYTDGHPGVEMALVELARETGRTEFVDLAASLIERRGHGYFAGAAFPPDYFQDHAPFHELETPVGHAVRLCYLAAGATDVAIERNDRAVITRLHRLWDAMVATKSYITGGVGSRHSGEDFGDAYELPSDRAYSETCAAIGAMQWGWRLLLATGDARIADQIDRILYNAFAVGVSECGTRFFYDNPLQRRDDHGRPAGERGGESLRREWFACACCPPNVVRWMAQLQDLVACATDTALTVVAHTTARIASEPLDVLVESGAPWRGDLLITVERARAGEALLRIRVPEWVRGAALTLNGSSVRLDEENGWVTLRHRFDAGDVILLEWRPEAQLYGAHPAMDAAAGRAAIVRGPVVYCIEQCDLDALASPVRVDDFVVTGISSHPEAAPDRVLRATGHAAPAAHGEPYLPLELLRVHRGEDFDVSVVPYFRWANRSPGAMRVWMRRETLSLGERTERGNKQ
ncbi:glycoside hydrolase family 127 protein [Leucobacter sp. wl10]|uniref:glycoside hydrolase family 127 protein n=1 Tax=Leucobacter sp. wl10 TaxID=2304677 RepID=UPI0013C2B64C|nr:beta-L-arabinofuranosidase domain-containing protein [Leucobacter sp. wl10]